MDITDDLRVPPANSIICQKIYMLLIVRGKNIRIHLIVKLPFDQAKIYLLSLLIIGAVQKLRNGQRGEGVDDFVTYRYAYFRG